MANLYDLVGDELDDELGGYGADIVGDDWDDNLGDEYDADLDQFLGAAPARRPRRPMKGANLAKVVAAIRAAKAPGIQRVQNRQLRRYPLGLGATSIGAGATAIISANPQLPFRVNRLITPSLGLLIDNLQVGTVSQFVAAGSVPTEVFAPNAFDVELKGDTAVPGVLVQITISNPTAGALVFSGAIIGTVAQ